jgi:molecular chaperone DnaK
VSSDPIVGIDLGTSNSVVAYADAGGAVRVLADEAGYRVHPSVVSFHPNGGVVVGAAAKQRKVIDPKNTIFSVKRLIGRAYDSHEVQTAKQRVPFQIRPHANGGPGIVTRAGEYAIPEISAIVLDHVRNVANNALGTPIERAVVTVPASFNDAQRSATATAGSIAGLTVVRVLNEPTAAALAYGHTRQLKEVIAVYDFGGGTFDITVLKLRDDVYEVLGTAGDSFLGGDDLDERLVDKMVNAFLAANRFDLRTNEVAMMRLRAVAEQTKIELSRRSRAVVRIDEIAYGPNGRPLDLQIEVKRDEFVGLVADIIDRTFPVCREALSLAQLGPEEIDDVVLVGGTTKIPYVRDQATKFFGKPSRSDVNPEEAVALGAALQARALASILARPKSASRQPTISGESMLDDTRTGDTYVEDHEHTATGTTSTSVPSFPPSAEDGPQYAPPLRTPKRPTAAYGVSRLPVDPRGERPAERGQHHDRVEAPTPPVALPSPGAPLGRLTKAMPAPPPAPPPVAARTRAPSAPPERVTSSTRDATLPTPPAATTAPTMRAIATPLQRTTLAGPLPPRPGALPPAPVLTPIPVRPPQAPTLMIEDEPSAPNALRTLDLDDVIGPEVTARGMVSPDASAAITALTTPTLPQDVRQAARSPIVLDVTPRGLGIGTVAGFCEELIRRNARLPAETRKLFTTSRDQQDLVRIIVCQGESRRLDDNVVIGDLVLQDLPPRPRGDTSIEVTFHLDASGILQVRARDAKTGKEQRASLDLVGNIPDAELAASRERLQALRR